MMLLRHTGAHKSLEGAKSQNVLAFILLTTPLKINQLKQLTYCSRSNGSLNSETNKQMDPAIPVNAPQSELTDENVER